MTATTLDLINQLAEERARLYRLAANGHRSDPSVLQRIQELTSQLEELWDRRRQERAGRREGIDLLIDRAYEQAYGSAFEDVVTPPRVGEEDDRLLVAA